MCCVSGASNTFLGRLRRHSQSPIPTNRITRTPAPTPIPIVAVVPNPPSLTFEGVLEEVAEAVAVVVCVTTTEEWLNVSQQGLHILFEQIQSLSQSSLLRHEAPRQCPVQVQAANVVLAVAKGCVEDGLGVVSWVMADMSGSGFNQTKLLVDAGKVLLVLLVRCLNQKRQAQRKSICGIKWILAVAEWPQTFILVRRFVGGPSLG